MDNCAITLRGIETGREKKELNKKSRMEILRLDYYCRQEDGMESYALK